MPSTTDTIIIGAGQAGLAISHVLTQAGHAHVLLERGRIGERWLSSSWDSLRLLTPNWMTRLPGWAYAGPQPDGYMTATEVARFLTDYARSFDAPVEHDARVELVYAGRQDHHRQFQVVTTRGDWRASNVVVATGWCDQPAIPSLAARLDSSIEQLVPSAYRRPAQLPDGGVLVVGASATGVQLADELRRAGRQVYLAVGAHSRVPRRYRGRDIYWWLDRTGALDRTIDEATRRAVLHATRGDDPRREPSLQLIGRAQGEVDLATLADSGVVLTGRLAAIDRTRVSFADDLEANLFQADRRLEQLLDRIDAYADKHGLGDGAPREALGRARTPAAVRELDLRRAGISTILWATGFRRSYPWLHMPALEADGEIAQRDGITPVPGLYVIGQRFQRTRRSNFLDGVGGDAVVIGQHVLRAHVAQQRRAS